MEIKDVEKIAKEIRIKPTMYHYYCCGGASFAMIDCYGLNEKTTCRQQGNDNWATPMCKNCKGLKGHLQLQEHERLINQGIEGLLNAIKQENQN